MSLKIDFKDSQRTFHTMTANGVTILDTKDKLVDDFLSVQVTGAISTDDATATAADILSGKTAYIQNDVKATGTMPNNGAVSEIVSVGGTYTVPAGYHNGSGTVSGPILDGNAEVANVVSGYTFYSNSGTKLTGTMAAYNWEWTVHHDTNPMTATAATDAGFSWS